MLCGFERIRWVLRRRASETDPLDSVAWYVSAFHNDQLLGFAGRFRARFVGGFEPPEKWAESRMDRRVRPGSHGARCHKSICHRRSGA